LPTTITSYWLVIWLTFEKTGGIEAGTWTLHLAPVFEKRGWRFLHRVGAATEMAESTVSFMGAMSAGGAYRLPVVIAPVSGHGRIAVVAARGRQKSAWRRAFLPAARRVKFPSQSTVNPVVACPARCAGHVCACHLPGFGVVLNHFSARYSDHGARSAA
jgi:hypothetical protein